MGRSALLTTPSLWIEARVARQVLTTFCGPQSPLRPMPPTPTPRFAALALASVLSGCGDEPAPTDAGVLPATFANVQPIFARGCSFRTCHGGTAAMGELNLGSSPAENYAALVNVASSQVPRMRRVRPGDPSMSWLIFKIDNTMRSVAECTAPGATCGVSMPERSDLLPASERDLIRRWVLAGAPGP